MGYKLRRFAKRLKSMWKRLIFKLEELFIFNALLFVFRAPVLAVNYMRWRGHYPLVAGFVKGFLGSKEKEEGLCDDDRYYIRELVMELLDKEEYWFAADLGSSFISTVYIETCFDRALLAKDLHAAWEIASDFSPENLLVSLRRNYPQEVYDIEQADEFLRTGAPRPPKGQLIWPPTPPKEGD